MMQGARVLNRASVAGVLTCAVVALGLLGSGAVASAARPHALTAPPTVLASTWQPTTTHDTTSSTDFTNQGVSCVSSTFCMSVGFDDTAETTFGEEWNGATWNEVPTVAPAGATYAALSGVSCVTTSFCEAVGEYEAAPSTPDLLFAEIWNGSS